MEAKSITRTEELLNLVNGLNTMILHGQILEAHDLYYAENVVQMENSEMSFEGKAVNREREVAFVEGITEFRGAEVKAVAVDPETNTTMVEWFMDYTHKDWGSKTYNQVCVARWNGEHIVHERYYNGG